VAGGDVRPEFATRAAPHREQSMTDNPFGLSMTVIIPARNEAEALPRTLAALPPWAAPVIVADYASTDGTGDIAAAHGAIHLPVTRPGYGAACLEALAAAPPCDVVVFLDADASDRPEEIVSLLRPIAEGRADFTLGSRSLGECEPGALTPQQRAGNRLACFLMRAIWGAAYTDLGPFRAIRREALDRLGMADRNFGWTVEMQIRAAQRGLRVLELPVSYRRRIGRSKISGTPSGALKAGAKILYVIAREAWRSARERASSGRARGCIG
jgi:glycosyltransferase involved in cell wall biosynthesis